MTDPGRMRLWTIQTKEAWERAGKLGVLEFNEIVDKDIDDWFRPAYDWMAGQLEERVKEYPCNKYPIWAWHHPKPDLRRSGHLPRDTMGVRVEILVNSDRVLLSDFEAWHAVLNCWYLSLSEEGSDSWDERSERVGIKCGWAIWAKDLKTGGDPELVEAYRDTVSRPFEVSENRQIAVEIVEVE
ncbi:MAG: DUF3841 domain-containing protein [Euryarchaeota archaeon]|nr:DUF3841 domain-containing protein [Euryarchaeota archaeon]